MNNNNNNINLLIPPPPLPLKKKSVWIAQLCVYKRLPLSTYEKKKRKSFWDFYSARLRGRNFFHVPPETGDKIKQERHLRERKKIYIRRGDMLYVFVCVCGSRIFSRRLTFAGNEKPQERETLRCLGNVASNQTTRPTLSAPISIQLWIGGTFTRKKERKKERRKSLPFSKIKFRKRQTQKKTTKQNNRLYVCVVCFDFSFSLHF